MKPATCSKAVATAPRLALNEPVLSHVSGAGLDEHFRVHGMYPPHEPCRDGVAAFTVRADVRLGDVLETVASLLRQADGIASALACDATADTATAAAAEALGYLLQQARGLHSLVLPTLSGVVLEAGAASASAGGVQ